MTMPKPRLPAHIDEDDIALPFHTSRHIFAISHGAGIIVDVHRKPILSDMILLSGVSEKLNAL